MSQNFEKKYLKYKQKYLNLVNQRAGAGPIGPNRREHEAAVYAKSGAVVKELYAEYGEKILIMLQNAAIRAIQMMQAQELTEDYNNIYMKKRGGKVFISGTISFGSRKLNSQTNPESWVKKNLTNIRSILTFLDLFVKLIGKYSSRAEAIAHQFDTVRTRAKDNTDDDMCIGNFIVPFEYDKSKESPNCIPMQDLIEPYSTAELFTKDETLPTIVSSGAVIFAEEKLKDSVGVFAAGSSGHTFDTLFLFILLFLDDVNDHKKLYLVGIACLIWMINYYHHSFREIMLPLTMFVNNPELSGNVQVLFSERTDNSLKIFDFIADALKAEVGPAREIDTSISQVGMANFDALINGHNTPQLQERINKFYTDINKFRDNNIRNVSMNIPKKYDFTP